MCEGSGRRGKRREGEGPRQSTALRVAAEFSLTAHGRLQGTGPGGSGGPEGPAEAHSAERRPQAKRNEFLALIPFHKTRRVGRPYQGTAAPPPPVQQHRKLFFLINISLAPYLDGGGGGLAWRGGAGWALASGLAVPRCPVRI